MSSFKFLGIFVSNKPRFCEWCNGTRLSKNLRRVWPKKCTTCPRTFSDSSKQCSVCGLAAHIWVHPDDGPDAQVWLVPCCHWSNQADGVTVKGGKTKPKWRKIEDPTFAVTIDEFNFGCDFCDEKFFSKKGAHSLLTTNFTSPALTDRVISTTYPIFDVLFSGLIKHIQNLCAIGTKKIFKVETISFFNFKPTGRRNICQMVAFFSIVHYSKKDSIYIM